ncbi:MAG: cytochrome-c peroxidase, partial [Flavobacteriales bacterium]|nr:cytochrome-c peroxidase [Flavobacteriales bacterium]
MRNALRCMLILVVICSLASCQKEEIEDDDVMEQYPRPELPEIPFNYSDISLPEHFFENDLIGSFQSSIDLINNTPEENPITDEGATLGRVLFYDVNLSQNKSISCASCHQQEHGFSDPAAFSSGFEGGLTGRHSMGLANAAYYGRGRFFWDERAATLEDQVLMPIQDPIEMGMQLDSVI